MEKYVSSVQSKLIYVMTIPDGKHQGCVKVGDATIPAGDPTTMAPNSKALNEAAKKRINEYTKTAAVEYKLLYTELLIYFHAGKVEGLRDYQVRDVLKRSGIKQPDFGIANQGSEWYCCDAETVKNAIRAAKEGRKALNADEINVPQNAPSGTIQETKSEEIHFREEQKQAIQKTIKRFKNGGKQMLWNAKMRFGKTLSTLEVIRQMEFHRTLIITHRPAVNDEWFTEFGKIFVAPTNWRYGSRSLSHSYESLEADAKSDPNKHYIYFASIQDLRGSELAGGKFDKNLDEFNTEWDLLVIDEAHEGTQTLLGQKVIDELIKERTHVLSLSGTPFNLLDEYESEEIFTWDYVMEQKAKRQWDINHFGDPNPYDELPTLNIYTFDLGNLLNNHYEDIEDKAFNFREFFRVQDEKLVHENDVRNFLDLMVKVDPNSCFPFSTLEFRKYFRHSLWMVPGVKEARALSELLKKHPIFSKFEIANVAGEGDTDMPYDDAKQLVLDAIGPHPDESFSITLSCGKLTTGVTIKPWTAVFMLSGSYSTDAKSYMQTIFRVQSPWNYKGKQKTECYVFDFAPDRTLKVIAETAKVSAQAGKTTESDKQIMGEFLNFCPVIGYNGTRMQQYDTNKLLEQLKRVYIDRVIRRGFDDVYIYSDKLQKVTGDELKKFDKLKKIIGTTKAMQKSDSIDLSKNGLTDEEYEKKEKLDKKKKKDLTPEEKEWLEQIKAERNQKAALISILRGISIRIPLLIYGAEIKDGVDITMTSLPGIVDDKSWEEFMPKGVTKEMYRDFVDYYDEDIIRAAARQIRATAKAADMLTPTERVAQIALIFSHFHNPDKETVLTPWRVVNMHLSNCLGGYCFFDESFSEKDGWLDEPRLVLQGNVTEEVFADPDTRILEINSKTGLYPLYAAYSTYQYARKRFVDAHCLNRDLNLEEEQMIWDEVVVNNIFVICKTEMARSITKRTLIGFRKAQTHLHAFEDLINQVQNKKDTFIANITRPSFWKIKTLTKMLKFNAIVGNPPYQIMDGGAQASAIPVYNKFVDLARQIKPLYISIIMPSRWMTGGRGLDAFRDSMILDLRLQKLFDHYDATYCFDNVEIKGGICYFLWNRNYEGDCEIHTLNLDGSTTVSARRLKSGEDDIFIRDSKLIEIKNKVMSKEGFIGFDTIVSSMKPYGLRGDFFKNPAKYGLPAIRKNRKEGDYSIIGLDETMRRTKRYVSSSYPFPQSDLLNEIKIFIPRNYGSGKMGDMPSNIEFAGPGEACTETFVQAGPFDSIEQAHNCVTFMRTKFFTVLVGIRKQDQGAGRSIYQYVPLVDFSKKWSDEMLYEEYGLTKEEQTYIETLIK